MVRHHGKNNKEAFQWMKYVVIMALFVVLAVVMAIYFLPFLAYYQVESAIITKDASKLASYTEFKELRRNLKAQKGQRVIRTLKKDDGKEQSLVDLSIVWSALSTDPAIDLGISTEGFYISLAGPGADRRKPDPIKPAVEMDTYAMIKNLIADSSFEYRSFSQFAVNTKDKKGRYVGYLEFIFTREGMQWRLTNVLIPVY